MINRDMDFRNQLGGSVTYIYALYASGRQFGGQSTENLNVSTTLNVVRFLQFINLKVARHELGILK